LVIPDSGKYRVEVRQLDVVPVELDEPRGRPWRASSGALRDLTNDRLGIPTDHELLP
jgi:hypothetical protein